MGTTTTIDTDTSDTHTLMALTVTHGEAITVLMAILTDMVPGVLLLSTSAHTSEETTRLRTQSMATMVTAMAHGLTHLTAMDTVSAMDILTDMDTAGAMDTHTLDTSTTRPVLRTTTTDMVMVTTAMDLGDTAMDTVDTGETTTRPRVRKPTGTLTDMPVIPMLMDSLDQSTLTPTDLATIESDFA